jgi:hypothetical protein
MVGPPARELNVMRLVAQMARGFARYVGLTWILGFGGMALAAVGRRDLAGLAWVSLGAGSVGVAFDRATAGELHFDRVRHGPLTEEEVDFLVGHLPFLALGLVAMAAGEWRWRGREGGREA